MAREETITNENQEQEKKTESVIENFEDVVENQEVEVVGNVEGIKDAGEEDVVSIKESDGLPEEVEEMKNVVDEVTEEAKETKEKYEEDLKNIPNAEDLREGFVKENEEVLVENTKEDNESIKTKLEELKSEAESSLLSNESYSKKIQKLGELGNLISEQFSDCLDKDFGNITPRETGTFLFDLLDKLEKSIKTKLEEIQSNAESLLSSNKSYNEKNRELERLGNLISEQFSDYLDRDFNGITPRKIGTFLFDIKDKLEKK